MKQIEEMEAYIMKSIIEHKGINATAVAEKFGIDRHTVAKHYKELIQQTPKKVRKRRDCPLLLISKIYEEYILDPESKLKATYMFILNIYSRKEIGSYSNFVQYVRKHYGNERRKRRLGLAHFRYENPPGDILQFDWIEDLKLELSTGEIITFNLYSGTLAYSRYHFYRVTFTKTRKAVIECIIDNLIMIGGRPIKMMTDNMSAIVNIIKKDRVIHPEISQFFHDMNIELILCKPKHPYTKGKVEASNKYQEWLKPYNKKFATVDEAMQLVPSIIMQSNYQRNSETNLAPLKLFTIKEKNALKDLPSIDLLKSYYGDFKEYRVPNTSLVKYMGASYGVPSEYIGETVYINESDGLVKIYDEYLNLIVTHTYHKSGIHYHRSMYDVMKDKLPKNMSKEEYEKMIEENLRLLAGLGEIEE